MAHTPGPWIATPSRWVGGNAIGAIRGGPEPWGWGGMVAYMTNPTTLNLEGEANAHLIAAAPELLAALEALLFYDTFEEAEPVLGTREHEVVSAARAAIAKAKGEVA